MKKVFMALLPLYVQAETQPIYDNNPAYRAKNIQDLSEQIVQPKFELSSFGIIPRGAISKNEKVRVPDADVKRKELLDIVREAHEATRASLMARLGRSLTSNERNLLSTLEDLNNRYDDLIITYLLAEPLGSVEKVFLNNYLSLNLSYDQLVLSQLLNIPGKSPIKEQEGFKQQVKKRNDDFDQRIQKYILDQRYDDADKRKFISAKKALDQEYDTFINNIMVYEL